MNFSSKLSFKLMNEFFSHNYVKINLVFVSFLRRMRRERDTQLRPSSSGKSFHEVSSSVNVRGVNSLFLCLILAMLFVFLGW